ncbi:MAG: glutamine--fructose-6-phosphate transaminase (isomerizing) [Candidatus Woesearchaeota archaeon]
MCGIIGCKGVENGNMVVINGLKRLEYRGYDSYGIGYLQGNEIHIFKKVGKISDWDGNNQLLKTDTRISIGHTRWATNGSVSEANSHPHTAKDEIAVVHNGIIENHQELRKELKEKGYKFYSETDTEIIPKLIHYYMSEGDDFKKATRKALQRLEGSFAIVAIKKGSEEMTFGRRGSPLVLGVGDNCFYIASDVPAFLEHTNKVIYLDDDEYGIIKDKIEVFDLKNDNQVNKDIKEINWSLESAKKGNYDHYLIKEIHEQKFTIKRAIEQDTSLVNQAIDKLQKADDIYFIACGTSFHAALAGSYIFSKIANKKINTVLASEFENYGKFVTDKSVVIGLSQSGETADLIEALKTAKKKGATLISIVNVMGSTITRLCDINIMMNSGPEICVLSTKSYSSQLAILILLAYGIIGKLQEGKSIIEKASKEVENLIDENSENLKGLAKQLKDQKSIFLIGREIAYPTSLEGALKIKEVSYIHAEGFAGGELKHGSIALFEKGVPAIIVATDETRQLIQSNASELKARGGYIIGIDSKPNEIYDYLIKLPEAGAATPILLMIPLQILAYYLALERGTDPDKPRNLAKSVTVK